MDILNRTQMISRPGGGYYIRYEPLIGLRGLRGLPKKLLRAPKEFVGLCKVQQEFHGDLGFIMQILKSLQGILRFICIDYSRISFTRHHDMASGLNSMYNVVDDDPENWMIDKHTGMPIQRNRQRTQ